MHIFHTWGKWEDGRLIAYYYDPYEQIPAYKVRVQEGRCLHCNQLRTREVKVA